MKLGCQLSYHYASSGHHFLLQRRRFTRNEISTIIMRTTLITDVTTNLPMLGAINLSGWTTSVYHSLLVSQLPNAMRAFSPTPMSWLSQRSWGWYISWITITSSVKKYVSMQREEKSDHFYRLAYIAHNLKP